MLLLGFISIIYKLFKDVNNENKNLKAKIYHMALKIMLQSTYLSFSSVDFKKKETLIML